ncbi:MAG: O-antigen ligase family protein, partial [Chloroflexi bacterium]|nr:O-antigen ligase family protein [Chloroflexota bacterium]
MTPTAVPANDAVSRVRATLRTDPGAWIAIAAFACWLAGHVPALAPVAIPAWVVTGLAVGLLRPWYGLLLTVVVVPFLGGAIEQMTGEPLRVLPVLGAAVRVLADRFVIAPSFGRPVPRDPAWPVVAAAVATAGLYALTAVTGANAEGRDTVLLVGSLQWLVGGPVAMMAAWVAGAHLVAGRDRTLTLVVLGTTVVACVLALAAWAGLPGVDLVTFPRLVEGGRLGALGYPTPTAMGLATVLPLAAVAAWRIRPWLGFAVVALVLAVIVLTWSRGPLIAVVAGTVVAALASGHVDRRLAVAGVAAGAVALLALVGIRYGTNIDAILATVNASMGSDGTRVSSWAAAVSIALADPLLGGGWHALSRVAEFAQRNVVYSH